VLSRLAAALTLSLLAAASAKAQTPAGPSRGLETFAASLGVTLGGGDDQAVFDAAEAAMKAAPGGLYVRVPPGRYRLRRIRFGANSGFYAEAPQTVILRQVRDPGSKTDDAFVALDDPHATHWLFWGFILDGGWRYGRAPYDKAPETDPWLDRQHAVVLDNAYNGETDDDYRRRSPIGAQNPRGRLGEITIANFGGDGLRVSGGGSSLFSALSVFNVGGRGVAFTSYDDGLNLIDIGGTGREGFYCGPACGSNRIEGMKIWFSGVRRLPGAGAGLLLDRADSNRIAALQVQDSAGDGVVLDHALENTIDGGVQWHGAVAWMDAPVSALRLKSARKNRVTLSTSISPYAVQAYPAIKWQVRRDAAKDDAGETNLIDILSAGLPEGPAALSGPLDPSDLLTINGRKIGKWP
jgi:hypothetical protein